MKKIKICLALFAALATPLVITSCNSGENKETTTQSQNQMKISYESEFGNCNFSIEGTTITLLPVLSDENNIFNGWYYENGTKAQIGDAVTSNTKLIASWTSKIVEGYSVVYISFRDKNVNKETNVTALPEKLPVLTSDEYQFDGWYLDNEFTKEAVAGSKISEDTILYAKWTSLNVSDSYSLAYYSSVENTSNAGDSGVISGNTIVQLPTMIAEGYIFGGWYYDAEFTDPAKEGDTITKDTVLYAKWIKIDEEGYSIIYITDHGTTPISVDGKTALPAELPTLSCDGYAFEGWYYDSSFTKLAHAYEPISSDTPLYAKWVKDLTEKDFKDAFETSKPTKISTITRYTSTSNVTLSYYSNLIVEYGSENKMLYSYAIQKLNKISYDTTSDFISTESGTYYTKGSSLGELTSSGIKWTTNAESSISLNLIDFDMSYFDDDDPIIGNTLSCGIEDDKVSSFFGTNCGFTDVSITIELSNGKLSKITLNYKSAEGATVKTTFIYSYNLETISYE